MIELCHRVWEYNKQNAGTLAEQLSAVRGIASDDVIIDPMCIADMQIAVQVCSEAVENGDRIVIFGDYDVDGVTSTALLMNYFEDIGAEVYYKLPNRVQDGYGISVDAVEMLHSKGAQLIITVDNGISAAEALECADRLGIKVVVTDHHEPPAVLPIAAAIVNPKRADDTSGYDCLCGAAVALCLIAGMEGCSLNDVLYQFGDLAAIGTVCDVMSLNEINRLIVKVGLSILNESPSPGVSALLEQAGHGDTPVTARTLGFTIGPRLNAAGRMEDPTAALSLLLAEDDEQALAVAEQLESCNDRRRREETELVELLLERAKQKSHLPVIVLYGEGYHEGVLGLAASRLCKQYTKPALVISITDDMAKGSGRSIPGFSLHTALTQCSHLLTVYGGHELAAGMSLKADMCEEFEQAINDYAKGILLDMPLPSYRADGVISGAVTVADIKEMDVFGPFGHGNHVPLFVLNGATIERIMPLKDKHLRLQLAYNGNTITATMFSLIPQQLGFAVGDSVSAILELSVYATQRGEYVSATVTDIRLDGLPEQCAEHSMLFKNFLQGAPLTPQQKSMLCADRNDVAQVYRNIEGISVKKPDKLFGATDIAVGKVIAAVYILTELGLIYQEGGIMYRTKNAAKTDLQQSSIMRGLQ